jgi:hypothetical protein
MYGNAFFNTDIVGVSGCSCSALAGSIDVVSAASVICFVKSYQNFHSRTALGSWNWKQF